MGEKKQNRRSKGKKIDPKIFLLIFGILLGSVATLGLFHYLSSPTRTISPPIYEEIYSITSDLNNEIGRIDSVIYESLYQRNVPEKNILFSVVKPKHEKGYDWDFTELLIKLSEKKSVFELEDIINIKLSQLKPTVTFKIEHIAKIETVWHIFTLGFYTHKMRLICEEYRKADHQDLPKIAIIIDDLGYDRDMAISFFQLNLPLCLSVLPLAPYTKYIADKANKSGRELILHLPLEPKGYPRLNPGPGTLLTEMDEKEIRRVLGDHLRCIPGLRGVNNHMGSYFTERVDKMSIVLSELKKKGLFYIDSRTTSQTVAFKLAKKIGVPVASRSVFLDNDLSPKAIRFQMERLLGIARHSGAAIGIGHPHKVTLKILKSYLPKLQTEVDVVPVSKLVN